MNTDTVLRGGFPWALAILTFFALAIAGYALVQYLVFTPASAGLVQGKIHLQDFQITAGWSLALTLHVVAGSLALLTGAVQFLVKRLSAKKSSSGSLNFHRMAGYLYAASILVSGTSGLFLAIEAMGGLVAVLGFFFLDVCWLAVTGMAVLQAFRHRGRHGAWMIRSYALTAAAITLRLWLPIFTALFQIDFLTSYQIISWLCWVPNLVFAEILVRRRIA